jgi:hypothetical protein
MGEDLFEFGANKKFFGVRIERDLQHVGPAAHLAIFDVALVASRGFVDAGFVPLAATRTLEAGGRPSYLA